MSENLRKRKAAAIKQLMAIDSARRGQLSKQYYTRKAADGRVVQQWPYYVWQSYDKGKKRSVRISRQKIKQVESEISRGREVQNVFDELWRIMEKTAVEKIEESKKTTSSARPAVVKRRAH